MHHWQRIILACLFLMAIVTALMMTRRSQAATLADGNCAAVVASRHAHHRPQCPVILLGDAASRRYTKYLRKP